MSCDVLREVVGLQLAGGWGSVEGYARKCVRGEHYPALFPASGGKGRGVFYPGISKLGWELLDEFEGDMYERQKVDVMLEGGGKVVAWTYVILPAYLNYVTNADWDFQRFLRNGIAPFRKAYLG
jgi:gamma-glutamylcyclotransferase (GGCT)/AIG2-like uncharacterized protein YtfP